jgi:RHS repeat-associated protein
MRKDGTLSFLLGDHLGSSSVTTNSNGVQTATQLYKAWGESRYASGNLNTEFKFTGQRDEASLGLYFYQSRWMDPLLGRFIQADTVVPGGIQGLDRYAYANNSPLAYTDPSGHVPVLIIAIVLLKVVDWGWTAWDVGASTMVLNDSDASQEDKLFASLNIALGGLEFIEPDDILPIGLPIDDLVRKGILKAFKESGVSDMIKFMKKELGDKAPSAIRQLFDKGLLGEIKTYGEWDKILKGLKGGTLEVHHLIEDRFGYIFGLGRSKLPAVVLDINFHDDVTQLLRECLKSHVFAKLRSINRIMAI